jgi:hypothetical protein
VVDEEINQPGKVRLTFDQQQEGHFRIDDLSGDSVEVDLDGYVRGQVAATGLSEGSLTL